MPGPYSLPTDRVTGGGSPAADMNAVNAALNEATAAATPSVLALRDASGRLKVASPSASTDAANKTYVDSQIAAVRGAYVGVNAQTGTSYTPVVADRGKLVTLNNAAAIAVTLPNDSTLAIAIGEQIDFAVIGNGMATFSAGAGATVKATPSAVTRANGSAVSAIKYAANAWLLVGDLATP